jgi:hypothetical protein
LLYYKDKSAEPIDISGNYGEPKRLGLRTKLQIKNENSLVFCGWNSAMSAASSWLWSLDFAFFSFPGSAWERMTWRLRLHYSPEFETTTGQSPEDIDSQAEPGNQERDNFSSTISVFLGLLRQPLNRRATFRSSYGTITALIF